MNRDSLIRRLLRGGALTSVAVSLALLWWGVAAAAAAVPSWAPVAPPGNGAWTVYDVWVFGSTSLVVTGDGGHVAVTRDAGATWKDVVVPGREATAFTAVALDGSGHGALASGGVLLVTADGGDTWASPLFQGPTPRSTINDIALRGTQVVAVGDDGMIIASGDAGATWRRMDSPTGSRLTSVAIAGDGTAVAGSTSGEILVERAGEWSIADVATGPVRSVTASGSPAWDDGSPDLVAATGDDVRGSDDGLTFATLAGLPDATTQPWSMVAWTGVPAGSLLIAGAQQAGFFDVAGYGWVSGASGLSAASRAVAPAGQSVGYLLGADGSLVRSLSAGRTPATAQLGRKSITAGQSTTLDSRVHVAAPGTLLLRTRVPGKSWGTASSTAWTTGDWDRGKPFTLSPKLSHEYYLAFRYGKTTVQLTPTVKLTVKPKVRTSKSRYTLRRGSVFRFSGSVVPRLRGERVWLYTDRGGKWRLVSGQSSVKLRDGRTWTSRRYGTPKRETYHLRARVRSTKAHGAAWSRIVTVRIR